MSTQNLPTFSKVLKAGLIAGLIGAGLNNAWAFIAQALGSDIPAGFSIFITISSLLPVLVGAVLFFVFVKFIPKGNLVWISLGAAFLLFSFYPPFTVTELEPGVPVGKGFPLLVAPMHAISGFLALWGIPRWSN